LERLERLGVAKPLVLLQVEQVEQGQGWVWRPLLSRLLKADHRLLYALSQLHGLHLWRLRVPRGLSMRGAAQVQIQVQA
jgi:hypothetical protein